jgi:predicted Fe-S protein YdhL (DUF1289 family)
LQDSQGEPVSPCNAICRIDVATGLCLGCSRTMEEIAAWPVLSRAERLAVLADLKLRSIRQQGLLF